MLYSGFPVVSVFEEVILISSAGTIVAILFFRRSSSMVYSGVIVFPEIFLSIVSTHAVKQINTNSRGRKFFILIFRRLDVINSLELFFTDLSPLYN